MENRSRPHSLGLLAYIFAARKNRRKIFSREDIFARRYFRGKLFSREDIFAGRYFRVNSIFAKIYSRENISNSLFAEISSRENKVLYSNCCLARMLPGEAELVSEWTGLSGKAKSVKRFERSNGLDTALYKNIPLPFTFTIGRYEGHRFVSLWHHFAISPLPDFTMSFVGRDTKTRRSLLFSYQCQWN